MITPDKEIIKSPAIYTFFLILLLISAIALGYSVAKPFLNTIVISIVLTGIFYPLTSRLKKRLVNRNGLAAFLTVCIIVFAIIIPAVIFFLGLSDRALILFRQLMNGSGQLIFQSC